MVLILAYMVDNVMYSVTVIGVRVRMDIRVDFAKVNISCLFTSNATKCLRVSSWPRSYAVVFTTNYSIDASYHSIMKS